MSRTDIMKQFDVLKNDVKSKFKFININAQEALRQLEKLESGPRGHIQRLIKEIIEASK